MPVIQLHPSLTNAQKQEQLRRYQFSEQRRCGEWMRGLSASLAVPDADAVRIKAAFDNVALIVNRIVEIGAEIKKLEQEAKPKRSPMFELAKDICAPPRMPDVMLTTADERAEALRPQEFMK